MTKWRVAILAALLAFPAWAAESGWRYGGFQASGGGWSYGSFAYDDSGTANLLSGTFGRKLSGKVQ